MKNKQKSLFNYKGAGRPAFNDRGIRHTSRPTLKKMSSLHLTIKVNRNKAEIKNKKVLKLLKHSIANARRQELKVIHFALEYDHVHLLIEAEDNVTLGKGMMSLGVTLAKGINRLKKLKGSVYKHRYHFRHITSSRQLKAVMNYIFSNGLKHKTAISTVSSYNSIQAEKKYSLFTNEPVPADFDLIRLLDKCTVLYSGLEFH